MQNERLIAKGRMVEMESRKFEIETEMTALAQSLHRKIPVVDGILTHIEKMDVRGAQALLARVKALHAEYMDILVCDVCGKEMFPTGRVWTFGGRVEKDYVCEGCGHFKAVKQKKLDKP